MFSLNIIQNNKENNYIKNTMTKCFIILTFMLLSIVLYFILKGCNNFCLVEDPNTMLKYNISK